MFSFFDYHRSSYIQPPALRAEIEDCGPKAGLATCAELTATTQALQSEVEQYKLQISTKDEQVVKYRTELESSLVQHSSDLQELKSHNEKLQIMIQQANESGRDLKTNHTQMGVWKDKYTTLQTQCTQQMYKSQAELLDHTQTITALRTQIDTASVTGDNDLTMLRAQYDSELNNIITLHTELETCKKQATGAEQMYNLLSQQVDALSSDLGTNRLVLGNKDRSIEVLQDRISACQASLSINTATIRTQCRVGQLTAGSKFTEQESGSSIVKDWRQMHDGFGARFWVRDISDMMVLVGHVIRNRLYALVGIDVWPVQHIPNSLTKLVVDTVTPYTTIPGHITINYLCPKVVSGVLLDLLLGIHPSLNPVDYAYRTTEPSTIVRTIMESDPALWRMDAMSLFPLPDLSMWNMIPSDWHTALFHLDMVTKETVHDVIFSVLTILGQHEGVRPMLRGIMDTIMLRKQALKARVDLIISTDWVDIANVLKNLKSVGIHSKIAQYNIIDCIKSNTHDISVEQGIERWLAEKQELAKIHNTVVLAKLSIEESNLYFALLVLKHLMFGADEKTLQCPYTVDAKNFMVALVITGQCLCRCYTQYVLAGAEEFGYTRLMGCASPGHVNIAIMRPAPINTDPATVLATIDGGWVEDMAAIDDARFAGGDKVIGDNEYIVMDYVMALPDVVTRMERVYKTKHASIKCGHIGDKGSYYSTWFELVEMFNQAVLRNNRDRLPYDIMALAQVFGFDPSPLFDILIYMKMWPGFQFNDKCVDAVHNSFDSAANKTGEVWTRALSDSIIDKLSDYQHITSIHTKRITVATVNAFGGKGTELNRALASQLSMSYPDIVVVQEAPASGMSIADYDVYYNDGPSDDNRMMIMVRKTSKWQVRSNEVYESVHCNTNRYTLLTTVEIKVPGHSHRSYIIANVHLCGGRFDEPELSISTVDKLKTVKEEVLHQLIDKGVDIILGDFNSDIKHHTTKTVNSEQESYLIDLGWTPDKIAAWNHVPFELLENNDYSLVPVTATVATSYYGTHPDAIWYKKQLVLVDTDIIDLGAINTVGPGHGGSDHNGLWATFGV